MANFSERLKELRMEMSWSQDTLADKLGVTRSTIGNYEQGIRQPGFEAQEDIADLFNVDLDFLMGRSDIKRRFNYAIMDNGNLLHVDPVVRESFGDLSDENFMRLLTYYKKLRELQDMDNEH